MNGITNNIILSTSPTDTPVELYVLQHQLQICSVPREQISSFTHAIIKIALLSDSHPKFFSFTETDDEFTLILPEKELIGFPDSIKTSGKSWRAFTVSTGAIAAFNGELAGVSKIAKAIISPLADCGISVFCISTYQSDFILVQEIDLANAIERLGKIFKIFDENHKKINGPKRGAVVQNTWADSKCRAITQPLVYPSKDYYVTGIDFENRAGIIQVLLELMFYSQQEDEQTNQSLHRFFHFSIIDGDISFVVDDAALAKFPPGTVYHSHNQESWRMVQVGNVPLGFEESGIVAKIAEPLASAQISIYYISTFNNDHALVPEEDFENVAAVLERRRGCFAANCCGNGFDDENEVEK